jgi:hypothetical protein
MIRNALSVLLLAFSFVVVQALPTGAADDKTPKKDEKKDTKKDDKKKDKSKDKDTEKDLGALKTSQATKTQRTLRGKIKLIDAKGLTLEVLAARDKWVPVEGILIPEDLKVRVPYEPEFDEKGKPKKFKPDPTDKDRRLGGVKGSVGDLHDGQSVVVQIGTLKSDKKKLVALVVVVVQEKK